MDQHRTPLRPPFDDADLDDAPGLTAGDEAALDAIRRQLDEEYPGADAAPSPVGEPAALPALPGRSGRKWPFLTALVTVAALGGGGVGAIVTAHLLREPGAMVAPRLLGDPSPAPGEPVVAVGHDTETVTSALSSPMNAGVVAKAPMPPPPDRAAPPDLRPRRQPPPVPAVSAPVTPPLTADETAARHPAVPAPRITVAASPTTQPDAASATLFPTVASAPNRASPIVAPEPQTWSDPFRPLSAETAAHAGVAKAAFRSSTASPVPAPAPPPTVPPLPAPGRVTTPAVASQNAEPAPVGPTRVSPDGSGEGSLQTTIREDWETVKSGFVSAPEDFRRAWRSLTRDLRGLLDR